MFQKFEETAQPEKGPKRLTALRAEIKAQGLDGFLVPRADVHQGEYVAPRDERLSWLTGFTGSAGFCAALVDVAGVFIDGRYRVQVKAQVADVYTPVPWPEVSLADWLREHLPEGGRVGFDPWLHTPAQIKELEEALDGSNIEMRRCANLVDRIWHDQPGPPTAPVIAQPLEYAGQAHDAKIGQLAKELSDKGLTSAVLTLPDSICWLLNIRGSDIARNPVAQGFAVLSAEGRVVLYMAAEKLAEVRDTLGTLVEIRAPSRFEPDLATLTGPVGVDHATAPLAVVDALEAAGVEQRDLTDPCILPKAHKNATEIEGARAAHRRDAVAMVRFLAWLDAQPAGSLTEIDVVRQLEDERRATNALRDISFETISGAGPHGAIVHYRVTEATNAPVEDGQLLLVDSGGQYQDGTTDITRTMAIGTPGREECEAFTRVLRGMIALSRVRWPAGMAGRDLDVLARVALWEAGLDYGHGTGHGVGSYLSVHEGPARLSRTGTVPLEPGMILSNEPGFYREGAYGIRIENLVVVEEAPALPGGTVPSMLRFETLTYVPIDRRLVLPELLPPADRDWLNTYHAQCRERLAPLVGEVVRPWLAAATAPL
ncbi:aminopeptidase P family protein [Primorskyibacter flagellatus]|uniref:aminopeptidase P family protein n=1 Tax=Primorskyibacter flagellatus TaxID=1387277 RepID=UPI003A90B1D7